jgi:hypothetical protein
VTEADASPGFSMALKRFSSAERSTSAAFQRLPYSLYGLQQRFRMFGVELDVSIANFGQKALRQVS